MRASDPASCIPDIRMRASDPASYTTIYKSIVYVGIRWLKIVYTAIYQYIQYIFMYMYCYISMYFNKVCLFQYISVYNSYTCIWYYILILWYFIRVYQRSYAYIVQFSKQFEKICITTGLEPVNCPNLVHTFRSHYHYAASTNTMVLQMSVTRVIFNRPCSSRSRHLAAGVGHPAWPAAPPALEVHWTHCLSTKGVTPGRPLGRGRQLDLS